MDAGFVRHPRLTFAHILPGALFMVLGPLQFSPAIRPRYLRFHRWSGHVFVLNGLVIGVSTLVMSYTMAIGGANETAATTFLGTIPKR